MDLVSLGLGLLSGGGGGLLGGVASGGIGGTILIFIMSKVMGK